MVSYIHKSLFFIFFPSRRVDCVGIIWHKVVCMYNSLSFWTNLVFSEVHQVENERLEVLGEFLLDRPRNGYRCLGGGWVGCSGWRVRITHGWWHGVRCPWLSIVKGSCFSQDMAMKFLVCSDTSYDVHHSHCHQNAKEETKHIHMRYGNVYKP